jgi:hypothetical protein
MKEEYYMFLQNLFDVIGLNFILLDLLVEADFHIVATATFEPFLPFHGPFTAPHGPEFFKAPKIFLRPLLNKGAVVTATWQPWVTGVRER